MTSTSEPNLIKSQISLRLTAEAQELLRLLAEKRGISKTAMLEILLRERADDEGVMA
jgi:hypothetical protein